MYKFCNKCGNITIGNKYLEEKCWVCGNMKIPIPNQYIQENEILTDKELAVRAIIIREELVKTSPEFDQYLFDHRDEIRAKLSSQYDATMNHGKAILEGKDKGNKFGISCPYCKATNIKKISSTSKVVKIGFFGIFGAIDDAGKQWKCTHCGSKF